MSKCYLADKARNKNGSCAASPQLLKKNTQVKPLCYVCGAHKLSSIDIVSFWMASITANVTFSRWSMKCRQSCLVLVMWKNYKVGKQTASALPRSKSAWVGCGERGGGVNLHSILHFFYAYKADNIKENTKFGNLLSAMVSGVIFQVIGVFSWTEVNHIRMSSSWRFCSISFFFKVHSNNSWSRQEKSSKLRVFHRKKNIRTMNSI